MGSRCGDLCRAFKLCGINDLALFQVHNASRPRSGRWIVSDHHNGLVALLVEPDQEVHHLHGAGSVKVTGRLIGKDERWARHNGARDSDALLLTAGKLPRVVRIAVCEPNKFECFGDALMAFFGRERME